MTDLEDPTCPPSYRYSANFPMMNLFRRFPTRLCFSLLCSLVVRPRKKMQSNCNEAKRERTSHLIRATECDIVPEIRRLEDHEMKLLVHCRNIYLLFIEQNQQSTQRNLFQTYPTNRVQSSCSFDRLCR